MQCPNQDGELVVHTRKLDNNLVISYSTCPSCRGYWMESFAANFITLPPDELPTEGTPPNENATPSCPICKKVLVRETGENVPDTIRVYRCEDNHGYFFPAGQLAAFKNAQHAKINYFKTWKLPLPSVASVLLASFLFLVLAGGGFFAFTNIQNQQVTTSKAAQLIQSHREIVNTEAKSVLIVATTNSPTDVVTLHVPAMNLEIPMTTTDHLTNLYQLVNVTPGPHTYYFTVTTGGVTTQSDIYDFTMPAR